MKDLHLIIISPEKRIFEGEVSSVTIPGIAGNFGVYPDHAPMVSPLKKGIITYSKEGKDIVVEISGGVAEIKAGTVTICVEQAAL